MHSPDPAPDFHPTGSLSCIFAFRFYFEFICAALRAGISTCRIEDATTLETHGPFVKENCPHEFNGFDLDYRSEASPSHSIARFSTLPFYTAGSEMRIVCVTEHCPVGDDCDRCVEGRRLGGAEES